MSASSRKPTAAQRTRHALIAAWRGVADGPIIDHQARSVGEVLGKVLKDLGLQERMALEEVVAAWRMAAGDFIAKHTQPESVTRGVLTVRVTQPTIHHALMMEKPALMKRLHEQLGHSKIKDVRFRHG